MNNSKGRGFRPYDEELIGFLRDRTLLGRDYLVQDITDLEVDICSFQPWDLIPGCSSVTSSDPVGFFTYPITPKHPNSKPKVIENTATGKRSEGKRKPMMKRTTTAGYWKVSGKPIDIKAAGDFKVIGIKTRLYFKLKSDPNKTSYVLYQYELTDVDPNLNKYFLGKLMVKQSKTTSSKGESGQKLPSTYSGNDHIPAPEIQLDFHPEPLVEMEVPNDYDCSENRSSISEHTNEFINPYRIEVVSNLLPSDVVADYAIRAVIQPDFHQEPLIVSEVPNDYYWLQNQSSISEQTNEFINPFPVIFNSESYERRNEENFVNDGNEVISNLRQPSNLVADSAVPQNLQVDYMELIKSQEVPNIGIGAQNKLYTNQHDNSFQNIQIDNDQTYPEERSNQHNVVAENESFTMPSNFCNNTIADNWFNFDDFCWANGLYLDELFGVPAEINNNDGAQNQHDINQQVADHHEFRNPNLTSDEIDQPDERNEPAAAAVIEGSNLPSLAVSESSHIMESVRKRSSMELERPSSCIETEEAQPQSKKSRF